MALCCRSSRSPGSWWQRRESREDYIAFLHGVGPKEHMSLLLSLCTRIPPGPNCTRKRAVLPPICLGVQGGCSCQGGQCTKLGVGWRTWLSLRTAKHFGVKTTGVSQVLLQTLTDTRAQTAKAVVQRPERWSSSHLEAIGSQRHWTGSSRTGAHLLWTFPCNQGTRWEKEWVGKKQSTKSSIYPEEIEFSQRCWVSNQKWT